MRRHNNVNVGAAVAVLMIPVVLFVGFWGTVIYVVGHFIAKFW